VKQDRLPRFIVSGTVVVITAGVVVFVGLSQAAGEPPPPYRTPGPSEWPSIDFEQAQREAEEGLAPIIERMLNPETTSIVTPMAVPTPVTIRGRQVELPDGMVYEEVIWSTDPAVTPRTAWVLAYVGPGRRISRLYVDQSGQVLKNDILPDHAALFEGVIAAAGGLLTPTPTTVLLAGSEITLPAGMVFEELLPTNYGVETPVRSFVLIYSDGAGHSRVWVDINGVVHRTLILPDHERVFAPVLSALDALRPN
jgi:hypothetical protein